MSSGWIITRLQRKQFVDIPIWLACVVTSRNWIVRCSDQGRMILNKNWHLTKVLKYSAHSSNSRPALAVVVPYRLLGKSRSLPKFRLAKQMVHKPRTLDSKTTDSVNLIQKPCISCAIIRKWTANLRQSWYSFFTCRNTTVVHVDRKREKLIGKMMAALFFTNHDKEKS